MIFSVAIRDKSLFAKLASIGLLTSVYAHMMDEARPVF